MILKNKLARVLLLLWVLPLAAALGAAALIASAGTVKVQVDERDGDRVSLTMPAVMADLAFRMIPVRVGCTAGNEMRKWEPLARVISEELASCPDGVLVEIDGPEKTRIEKRHGGLIVDVNTESETVHLSFPVRTARVALDWLCRSGGRTGGTCNFSRAVVADL